VDEVNEFDHVLRPEEIGHDFGDLTAGVPETTFIRLLLAERDALRREVERLKELCSKADVDYWTVD